MKNASFDATKEDSALIIRIADRANRELSLPLMGTAMDVTACHANGNPLRLQELLDAPPADFGHDIHGIARYLNRKTGKLTQKFTPRLSV